MRCSSAAFALLSNAFVVTALRPGHVRTLGHRVWLGLPRSLRGRFFLRLLNMRCRNFVGRCCRQAKFASPVVEVSPKRLVNPEHGIFGKSLCHNLAGRAHVCLDASRQQARDTEGGKCAVTCCCATCHPRGPFRGSETARNRWAEHLLWEQGAAWRSANPGQPIATSIRRRQDIGSSRRVLGRASDYESEGRAFVSIGLNKQWTLNP